MAARIHPVALALLATVLASPGAAQVSLLNNGFLGGGGAPLVAGGGPLLTQARYQVVEAVPRGPLLAKPNGTEGGANGDSGSLFVGQASGGFFAPLPPRESGRRYRDLGSDIPPLGPHASGVERLRQIIGHAESRADGYDAINYGAKRLPARRPTDMTLGEIYAWIEATPGQPHAIGRYQFIPSTLKRLAEKIGAGPHERFSPRLQDLLADQLFAEAGFVAFRDGIMPRRQFMNNLAKIWAGLPNSSGRSHYHGYAGNRATMTWAHFDTEMATIFPG